MTSQDVDPVTFAVVKCALDTIVDEMAFTVMRTARSNIVRDVLDYSTTLCDRDGNIVTQARTVALHLGAVPDAIARVIELYRDDLVAGDVVIMNDPYEGGMHLPDIFMFKPIFFQDRLQAFSVVICHHCDVGGRVPGSNASDSTEIFQEGLRIPPLKLYEAGRPNRTLFRMIEQNVRLPELVLGDLAAQYATCRIGEREYLALLARYGEAALGRHVRELIDYAERMTRQAIAAWPDGSYGFTDHIDGDGFDDRAIPITVTITVEGDRLVVDYTGSSPQVKGALNSTFSFTKSATYLSVRCMLDKNVPNNQGVFRCIEVRAPRGSVLNPLSPAPVAARALTGYRVVDAMFGCLAQIVPERAIAAGEGGNTVVCISGRDEDTREPFILVDMINGAWGGRADKDGIEGVTNPSQNMSNMPVETLEARYPIRVEDFNFLPDSCGAGLHRGGLGLVRSYRLLAKEAVLQLRSDRHTHRPWGLYDGKEAAATRNILGEGDTARMLGSKVTMTLEQGDLLRHEQSGGGGYGDPLARPPECVAEDVADGKISATYARREHGVVMAEDGRSVDLVATEHLRACMREGVAA